MLSWQEKAPEQWTNSGNIIQELRGSQLLEIKQVDVWGKMKYAVNFCWSKDRDEVGAGVKHKGTTGWVEAAIQARKGSRQTCEGLLVRIWDYP